MKARNPKKLPDPYVSPVYGQENDWGKQPITRRRVEAGKIWINPNDKPKPADVVKKIQRLTDEAIRDGYTDIRVETQVEQEDESSLEKNFIVIIGDRKETKEDVEQRLRQVRANWQQMYEAFLRHLMFYLSPGGRAQVQEIMKHLDRPLFVLRDDEQDQGFRELLKQERKRFEK